MRENAHHPATGPDRSNGLESFLEVLGSREPPGGFIELRSRRTDDPSRLRQHWFHTTEIFAAAGTIRGLGDHTDVYVGVAPRRARHGGKAAIAHSWVLWADLDHPAGGDRLSVLPVAPGIIVASGTHGHRHLYWPLTHPATVTQTEQANAALAAALGADQGAVLNAATILRPPDTRNHKHQPPTPVLLEQFDPTAHPLATIVGELRAVGGPRAERPASGSRLRPSGGGDPLLAMDPAVYVAALTGEVVPRGRKVSCPLHTDTTPSLHAYPTPERGWTCFGCGRGGSIYDLAAHIWQLDTKGNEFLELRARLRQIFLHGDRGLGVAGRAAPKPSTPAVHSYWACPPATPRSPGCSRPADSSPTCATSPSPPAKPSHRR